jgi:hypothetical protein
MERRETTSPSALCRRPCCAAVPAQGGVRAPPVRSLTGRAAPVMCASLGIPQGAIIATWHRLGDVRLRARWLRVRRASWRLARPRAVPAARRCRVICSSTNPPRRLRLVRLPTRPCRVRALQARWRRSRHRTLHRSPLRLRSRRWCLLRHRTPRPCTRRRLPSPLRTRRRLRSHLQRRLPLLRPTCRRLRPHRSMCPWFPAPRRTRRRFLPRPPTACLNLLCLQRQCRRFGAR